MIVVKKIHLFGGYEWARIYALGPWVAIVEVEPAPPEGDAVVCALHGERVVLSTPSARPQRGLSALAYRGDKPPPLAAGDVLEEAAE